MSDDNVPLHQRRLWEFQPVRDLLVLTAILALLWLGYRLTFITAPLLFGIGLAYLFAPVVVWLCGRFPRLGRLRAVLLLLAAVVLAGLAALAVIIPPLVHQGVQLVRNSDRYATAARSWVTSEERPDWLRDRVTTLDGMLAQLGLNVTLASATGPTPAASATTQMVSVLAPAVLDEQRVRELVRAELERLPQAVDQGTLVERAKQAMAAIGSGAIAVIGSVISLSLFVVIALFTAVSCLLRWPDLMEESKALMPERMRARVLPLIGRMDATVSAFIRGRITVAAIVGVLYATGWTIVGVPYGLILGLGVGILSIVPYLAMVGLPAAWLLLALSLISHPDGGGWYITTAEDGSTSIAWLLVLVLPWVVNLVTQAIEDYVLNPIIQGKATELHPVVIMLAVLAGGSLAGLYGMLLAVPVAACLKILLVAEIIPRLRSWAGAES